MSKKNKKFLRILQKNKQIKFNKDLPSTWIPDDEGFDLSFDYVLDENPKKKNWKMDFKNCKSY